MNGQLKLPAATGCWRLVLFHLINEDVGLGTQSQPQTVPSKPFRPLFKRSVVLRVNIASGLRVSKCSLSPYRLTFFVPFGHFGLNRSESRPVLLENPM